MAVNYNDGVETVKKYVAEGGFSFPIVMGGSRQTYTLGKAYGVQAYPTNYLIGPDGKVLWRGVGFREAELRAAITAAGIR